MDHCGVILRKLREINRLPLKEAAKKIERGAGWLSEIENEKGAARINHQEFERIVAIYSGEAYRKQFGLWIAKRDLFDKSNRKVCYDGAILKYLRKKAKLTLDEAAIRVSRSKGYLSRIENGTKPLSLQFRNQLLEIYGYSPSSFKNFTTEDKRAKNIPIRYKFEILLSQIDEKELERLFLSATASKSEMNK